MSAGDVGDAVDGAIGAVGGASHRCDKFLLLEVVVGIFGTSYIVHFIFSIFLLINIYNDNNNNHIKYDQYIVDNVIIIKYIKYWVNKKVFWTADEKQ